MLPMLHKATAMKPKNGVRKTTIASPSSMWSDQRIHKKVKRTEEENYEASFCNYPVLSDYVVVLMRLPLIHHISCTGGGKYLSCDGWLRSQGQQSEEGIRIL